ncbi:MAG TPA: helix-hairpin-helix domain-containing protein [Cytophagaceae bacterium]
MKFLKVIRGLFVFSRKEANGFLIVVFLIGIYVSLPWFFKKYSSSDSPSDKDSLLLQAWIMELNSKEDQDIILTAKPKNTFSYFDPNTATKDELIRAGIHDWLAERIINYREKVGAYKDKKDLLKVYGFSEQLYDKLNAYVQINKIEKAGVNTRKENNQITYDLNLVTAPELQKVKGIGPILSERIIKFRNKLGGFVNIDQVKEVYGLDSSVVKELGAVVYVAEDFVPEKININLADENVIAVHPYIKKYKAKEILVNRAKAPIANIDQLKELKIFTEEELLKVAPYLSY